MSEIASVAMTTVLCILVAVDIAGNSLVCLIIKKNRDMRYVVGVSCSLHMPQFDYRIILMNTKS